MLASGGGHLPVVKALLQHRAQVDLRSKASAMRAFMLIDLHDDGIGFFM